MNYERLILTKITPFKHFSIFFSQDDESQIPRYFKYGSSCKA